MCDDCGCGEIEINVNINHENEKIAEAIKTTLNKKSITCINLLGSPGSGKTTLIENIAEFIPKNLIAVIQGDLESDVDKKRLIEKGIDTHQINTHSGCHLNAHMIEQALTHMNLVDKKFLIIENVGNLVCPVGINLGQHLNLLAFSTTEGSDKPMKYPLIFRYASIICVTKSDLVEYVDFDLVDFKNSVARINHHAEIFQVSSRQADSFKEISQKLQN